MVPNFVSVLCKRIRQGEGRRSNQNQKRPISQYVKPTSGIEHDSISLISKPQMYFSSVLNSAKKNFPANSHLIS